MGLRRFGLICLLSILAFGGCAKDRYVVEVRLAETHQPLEGAHIRLVSTPRGYSFLDIRHYVLDCGRMATDEGITDEDGSIELSLPKDSGVGAVMVNDKWGLSQPSVVWKVMQPTAPPPHPESTEESRLEARVLAM